MAHFAVPWFRDYIYIPLGGVTAQKRQAFNMFVVWACTGMWHGAAWNFVVWGCGSISSS